MKLLLAATFAYEGALWNEADCEDSDENLEEEVPKDRSRSHDGDMLKVWGTTNTGDKKLAT